MLKINLRNNYMFSTQSHSNIDSIPHNTHPFHLVDISPWPILASFALLSGALALVNWLTLGEMSSNVLINSII